MRCCAVHSGHCVTLNAAQWDSGTVGRTYLQHWAMENNWNSEISYLALGSCCCCRRLFSGFFWFWKTRLVAGRQQQQWQQQPVLTHGDPQKHVQWKCA